MQRRSFILLITLALSVLSSMVLAQGAAEDGVLRSCLAKGNTTEVCICASLVLHARLGDESYIRFGEVEDRLAALTAGAVEAAEGEEMALMSEGYRFFIPHGQAISVCAKKIAAGE